MALPFQESIRWCAGRRARAAAVAAAPLDVARQVLLAGTELPARERELLEGVDTRVDPDDGMFRGDPGHYLQTGLSAMRCIDTARAAGPRAAGAEPARILDFPCG